MKVLVIGSGGREHAICYAFKKSPKVSELFCANGNAGIAEIATCVPIKHDETERLADFASSNSIDLTFAGGETPLALGIVDEFESRGLKIVGPCRRASQLEASKSFAKDFMERHNVPTAKYATADSTSSAVTMLNTGEFGDENMPVVVKADGLAAGKGVVVARDRMEAIAAINDMAGLVGSDAAQKIVLEECLFGKEISLLMFADGEDFALMPPVRDHKRIGDGNTGPNTGGMGTFTDKSLLSDEDIASICSSIVRPTLQGCISEGFRFRGILFLGIMMTSSGPKLLEYNVRFGDPETQSILVRLETDLVDICQTMLTGDLKHVSISWRPGSSACVVLASRGYPATPKTGDLISGLEEAKRIPGIEVFHAGTAAIADSEFYTAGGRVLGLTATGADLPQALETAYQAASKITFDGMQYRRDIGR